MSSTSQHTIDNLCKRDKREVVETLKQINELRRRCTILECQIARVDQEQTKLLSRDATLMKQIELTEEQMLETTETSRSVHENITQLTIDLQSSETENEDLKSRINDLESDIAISKQILSQLKSKYEKICVDTSVLCTQEHTEIETNTDDPVGKSDVQSQVLNREMTASSFLNDDTGTEMPVGWGSIIEDADEDVSLLIALLNKN